MKNTPSVNINTDNPTLAHVKAELEARYLKNSEFLLSRGYIPRMPAFDDLPFWVLSTGIGHEYGLYDVKERRMTETIHLEYRATRYLPLSLPEGFADVLILVEWELHQVLPYLQALKRKKRKSYIVVKHLDKFLSCFEADLLSEEILSDVLIFHGFSELKEYFLGCSAYLPRNIIDLMRETEQAKALIDEIHAHRISRQGRRGDNILLSLCIPSWDRGNQALANVRHHLGSYYDEELEVVLSNNGSMNESRGSYERIHEIDDARLKYFAFEENQDFALNLCQVVELAQGRYIMLLSDEDTVDLDKLPQILKVLLDGPKNLAEVRTRGNVQQSIPATKLAAPGEDALLTFSLTSNYMSGIFFNRPLLLKYGGIDYVRANLANAVCWYYPHMFWELLMCQYGMVLGTNVVLIHEGPAHTESAAGPTIPFYASLKGRLEQHRAFTKIFRDLEICQKSPSLLRQMHLQLCCKTLFLVNLSISVFYAKMGVDLAEILYEAYLACLDSLADIYDQQGDTSPEEHYAKDLENIRKVYLFYRTRLAL